MLISFTSIVMYFQFFIKIIGLFWERFVNNAILSLQFCDYKTTTNFTPTQQSAVLLSMQRIVSKLNRPLKMCCLLLVVIKIGLSIWSSTALPMSPIWKGSVMGVHFSSVGNHEFSDWLGSELLSASWQELERGSYVPLWYANGCQSDLSHLIIISIFTFNIMWLNFSEENWWDNASTIENILNNCLFIIK